MEMGFGSDQGVIGFFTDVFWIVTFDSPLLMTVEGLGCRIKINTVAGQDEAN